MAVATRGDFASALYAALGIESPSSTGQFSDAGQLDGVTSTLADLGITYGVGDGAFGTEQTVTRGQAFTMMARALGLVGGNASIEQASQALVTAGIVSGYADGSLQLNAPLESNHVGLLMERMAPELERPVDAADPGHGTVGDSIHEATQSAADTNLAREDSGYAAYLAHSGVRLSEIQDEIALREDLFHEDTRRRSETYQRATDQAIKGHRTDFENRGLFRSGTRARVEADKRQKIGYQEAQENYAAQRDFEQGQRVLGSSAAEIERQREARRIGAAADGIRAEMEDGY